MRSIVLFLFLSLVFFSAASSGQPESDSVVTYSAFTIVSPTNDEGVRANGGSLTVVLSLQPDLQTGHTIVLNVDGQDGEKIQTGGATTITLSNMSRGLHTVKATVLDDAGAALIEAGPVSFHVLRVAGG